MNMIKKICRIFHRRADVAIGGWDNPYLLRWHIIPKNNFFNIYLHKMLRDDDDRALHDHPWVNVSIILKEGYIEHQPRHLFLFPADPRTIAIERRPGHIIFRRAKAAHRLELHKPGYWEKIHYDILPAWSLFITGPKIREWGFWCPNPTGWRHWKDFTDATDSSRIGRGCN